MSTTKIVYGLYADDDDLMSGVKAFREKGIDINEVYTPFPVHGLDKALGLKKINQVVEKNDTPQIRGMLKQVDYMIEVEE